MQRIDGDITEYRATTAEEFWSFISPQKYIFGTTENPIFRGQADSRWKLEPSILREGKHPAKSFVFDRQMTDSSMVIFAEIHALKAFVEYCDSSGLTVPGDSGEFRRSYLTPTNAMDAFILLRETWPPREYYEVMAIAQHYGLPTRLLDWTRRSHVAAYFAAAGALQLGGQLQAEDSFAVWALNTQNIEYKLKDIKLIAVPGSNNSNIAAQQGLFTLVRQDYSRGGPFRGPHRLDEYIAANHSPDLVKITLSSVQAPQVLDLCSRYGVTAATLHPDFYGAARATLDHLACWARSEWTSGQDILAEKIPALGPDQKPGSVPSRSSRIRVSRDKSK